MNQAYFLDVSNKLTKCTDPI